MTTDDIETASGYALAALAAKVGIKQRPDGMTDAELRAYMKHGYVVRLGPITSWADRRSPPVMIFVPGMSCIHKAVGLCGDCESLLRRL